MTARVSVDRIKRAVADEYHMPLREMTSHRRDRDVARPRQVAMALAARLTPHSSVLIGRLFGGRDHSTVMHARQRVAELCAADPDFDRRFRRIEADLNPSELARPELQLAFLDGPLFDHAFGQPAAAV